MELKFPILVVNFKNYPESQGRRGIELAKKIEKAALETGKSVAVAPPTSILMKVVEEVQIPVFAQHADPVEASATTGYIPVEAIKEAGAIGSIINHSEHKVKKEHIEAVIKKLRSYNLYSLTCAEDPKEASEIATLEPDIIAIEPPELIGTGISVSKAKPEVITNGVNAVMSINKKIKVLAGAGISYYEDVKKALELGAQGVLVASAIVKAKDPYAKTLEFLKAFP
ncbi:MAG: triose-phosphate isomerase [Sulfolobaceae archaeon]|nr:triose-phosphate isomerase [Sulfolobaceae archaeon]